MILCALFETKFVNFEKFRGSVASPWGITVFGEDSIMISEGYSPAAYKGKSPHAAVVSTCDESVMEAIKNTEIIIVPSDNMELLRLLRGKNQVITCGLKNTDTVTVSSISEDCITIAVMREMISVSGHTVCPREIPLKGRFVKECDIFTAMAGCVIPLICR